MSSRRSLPSRRRNKTWHVHIGGESLFLTIGFYEDGTVGEVFMDMSKQGSALRSWIKETSRLFSLAVQYGVPIPSIVTLFRGGDGQPNGPVIGHPTITSCTSVMDFVAQCLQLEIQT